MNARGRDQHPRESPGGFGRRETGARECLYRLGKVRVRYMRGGYALAVIPASHRLDVKCVRAATDPHARFATEFEIARDLPGYELGAISPIGSLVGLPTIVDPELARHETIVFAAGYQTESVQMRTADLPADRNTSVVPITRLDEDDELFDADS